MTGFIIKREPEKIASINRTIRLKPELFDWLNDESERTGVSFNKIVNQCIEFSRDNAIDEEEGAII